MNKYNRQDMMEMADRLSDGYRTNPDHLELAAAMLREAAGPGNVTQSQLDAATKPLHARIRELEAAQCKHHTAATMQLPCMACGRDWRAHSVAETKDESQQGDKK